MRRRSRPAVQTVTAARSSLSDDIHVRTRNYLISMGIRSVCLVAAVVATGPLRWILVAGAIVLPYFAVVAANAGRKRPRSEEPVGVGPEERPMLEPGSHPGGDAPGTSDDDR